MFVCHVRSCKWLDTIYWGSFVMVQQSFKLEYQKKIWNNKLFFSLGIQTIQIFLFYFSGCTDGVPYSSGEHGPQAYHEHTEQEPHAHRQHATAVRDLQDGRGFCHGGWINRLAFVLLETVIDSFWFIKACKNSPFDFKFDRMILTRVEFNKS